MSFLGQLRNILLQLCGKIGLQPQNSIQSTLLAALWREIFVANKKTCMSPLYLVLLEAYEYVTDVFTVIVLVFEVEALQLLPPYF